MEDDPCYELALALENKHDMSRMALRILKKHCISNDLSWEIKRCCDYSIYKKYKSVDTVSQFCSHIAEFDRYTSFK